MKRIMKRKNKRKRTNMKRSKKKKMNQKPSHKKQTEQIKLNQMNRMSKILQGYSQY